MHITTSTCFWQVDGTCSFSTVHHTACTLQRPHASDRQTVPTVSPWYDTQHACCNVCTLLTGKQYLQFLHGTPHSYALRSLVLAILHQILEHVHVLCLGVFHAPVTQSPRAIGSLQCEKYSTTIQVLTALLSSVTQFKSQVNQIHEDIFMFLAIMYWVCTSLVSHLGNTAWQYILHYNSIKYHMYLVVIVLVFKPVWHL